MRIIATASKLAATGFGHVRMAVLVLRERSAAGKHFVPKAVTRLTGHAVLRININAKKPPNARAEAVRRETFARGMSPAVPRQPRAGPLPPPAAGVRRGIGTSIKSNSRKTRESRPQPAKLSASWITAVMHKRHPPVRRVIRLSIIRYMLIQHHARMA